jgi:hypothetical protein
MKKFFLVSLMALVLTFTVTASADAKHNHGRSHNWSHAKYKHSSWQRTNHSTITISWHQHRNYYPPARYRMERIYHHGWNDRFPGLRAYQWHDRHGEGFWYRGHHVTEGVFFYNDSDELVSVGFMHNGAFIFIRDDKNGYENRDTFFLSWFRH